VRERRLLCEEQQEDATQLHQAAHAVAMRHLREKSRYCATTTASVRR
jgi:hypothetical protein